MKSFISAVCALFIFGCSNDSTPLENTSTAPAVLETNTTITEPAALETAVEQSTPSEQTAPAPAAAVVSKSEDSTPKVPTVASVDGGALYNQKCASCHGSKAEKSALNKSQIIAQFSETQIKEALKGYQTGTYGKEMKALMQGQAKGLNDAQINALAKYISTL